MKNKPAAKSGNKPASGRFAAKSAQRRRALAELGENAACEFLKRQNYSIVARNFYSRYGEIDIIASKGKTLYFFEVKTRRPDSINAPEEAVTFVKLQRLMRTAMVFFDKNPVRKTGTPETPGTNSWRISLIGILLNGGKIVEIKITPIS